MSEFLQGLGYWLALVVACAGVSFGLIAGLRAATWLYGPITINFKHSEINVNWRGKE